MGEKKKKKNNGKNYDKIFYLRGEKDIFSNLYGTYLGGKECDFGENIYPWPFFPEVQEDNVLTLTFVQYLKLSNIW